MNFFANLTTNVTVVINNRQVARVTRKDAILSTLTATPNGSIATPDF